jgi:hypothetical protein
MPTKDALRQYMQWLMEGADACKTPSPESLEKRIYRDTCHTSTCGDIRLIGAWLQYHEGGERVRQYSIWPTRGNKYVLERGARRVVTVDNSADHRNGVRVVEGASNA